MKSHVMTLLKLWGILRLYHKWFYLTLGLIFVEEILNLGSTIMWSRVMDALVTKNARVIFILVAIQFAVETLSSLVSKAIAYVDMTKISLYVPQFLQEYSLKRILRLTPAQHAEDHSALKLSILNQGEANIKQVIDGIVSSIIPTVTLLVVSLSMLLSVRPIFAIIASVLFVFLFAWSYHFQKDQHPLIAKNRDNWNEQNKFRTEAFVHLGLVKMLSREEQFTKRYIGSRTALYGHHLFTVLRSWRMNLWRGVVINISDYAIWALAIIFYLRGDYTIGTIFIISSMLTRIFNNVGTLTNVMRDIPLSFIHIEKYLEIVDREPNFDEGGETTSVLDRDITFDHVSFKYPKAESSTLRDCSFTIGAGKMTAFVGRSGSGKSTITRLLTRAYDYNEGSIRIGGEELKHIDAHHLREHMGIVEQHVDLFDDTVKNNILISVAESDIAQKESELENIGRLARIDTFYDRLGEKKWDTLVGERGIKLSGGERQRIGIARAIIKNPEILIFDEATASLDTVNEKLVMDAIAEVTKDRTSIFIAHRLSTVRNADQIIVLDKGSVVAAGTHEELMQSSSHYSELVAHQVEENQKRPQREQL